MGFMDKVMNWLSQQSTWKGIAAMAALIGLTLPAGLQESVLAIATAVYGLIAMFWDKS